MVRLSSHVLLSSAGSPAFPRVPSPQTFFESAVEVLLERRPVSADSAICSSTVRYSLVPHTNPFISLGFRPSCQRADCVGSLERLRVIHRDTFTDTYSNSNTEAHSRKNHILYIFIYARLTFTRTNSPYCHLALPYRRQTSPLIFSVMFCITV